MHKQLVIEICDDPVFVIGSPRSGTSVLAWSLAQHPDFWTSPETDFLYWLFGRGQLVEALAKSSERADGGWLPRLGLERSDLVQALGLGLNSLISSKSGGRRWVDQSPTYTLVAAELSELFAGARFLHILRDGPSVVHSMVNSGFDTPWASDFGAACQTWAHFVTTASQFAASHPTRCLTVPYAELVAQPRAAFGEMLDFLGGDEHPGPAEFFVSNRINSSFQPDGDRSGEFVRSDPRESWTASQRAMFAREADTAMDLCGFAVEFGARA